MVKLETVEDFEKAKKYLDDSRTESHQYRIKEFGYCSYCREVTEYHHNANIEGTSVVCCKCKWGYYRLVGESVTKPMYFTYLELSQMPYSAIISVIDRHSRDSQKEFFNQALEQFITKQKAIVRQANNLTRRLAKLRA